MGKSGENLTKVCAICSKKERRNWLRHWKRKHPGETPEEAPKEELNKCSGDNERPQSQEPASAKSPRIEATSIQAGTYEEPSSQQKPTIVAP
jgi:hypothetical protein